MRATELGCGYPELAGSFALDGYPYPYAEFPEKLAEGFEGFRESFVAPIDWTRYEAAGSEISATLTKARHVNDSWTFWLHCLSCFLPPDAMRAVSSLALPVN